jgi:BolA family transcriptional regulator, general stress-responsive regulator
MTVFTVLIVSDAFCGRSLVERQRAVYAALGDAMRNEIHALALRTLTAEEWNG